MKGRKLSVLLALAGLLLGGGLALFVGRLDAVAVLVVGVGTAALLLMLRHPELPVHVVLLVVYTNVGVVLAQEGPVPPAVAGGVVGLLAIPLAYWLVVRRAELRLDTVFFLMVALLGVFALSAARALDTATSLQRIIGYAVEGLLLYALLLNVIRTAPMLRRAVGTLLLAGSVLGGLSLLQAATGSYEQDFGGLAQSSFAFAVDDAPAGAAAEGGAVRRAGGPMDEPNRFAQILIVLFALGLFQMRFGGRPWSRFLGLGATLLVLAGTLLTYSRGAFLTLAVLVAIMAMVGFVRPQRVVLAVVVLLAAVPFVAPGFYERVGSIGDALAVLDPAERAAAEPVARGRTTETLAAFHAFLDHPVLGVGPGHYLNHYSVRYQLDPNLGLRFLPEPRRAHNLFAEVAAESGAAGLLIFLSIPAVLIGTLWRRRAALLAHRPDLAHLATAFAMGILAYLGTGVFLHLAFERYYWLLLALAAAACRIFEDEGERLAEHEPPGDPGRPAYLSGPAIGRGLR